MRKKGDCLVRWSFNSIRAFLISGLDPLSLKWHQVKSLWLTPFMNNRLTNRLWRAGIKPSQCTDLTKWKDCCEHCAVHFPLSLSNEMTKTQPLHGRLAVDHVRGRADCAAHLSVNCAALCEGIFGKLLLITVFFCLLSLQQPSSSFTES